MRPLSFSSGIPRYILLGILRSTALSIASTWFVAPSIVPGIMLSASSKDKVIQDPDEWLRSNAPRLDNMPSSSSLCVSWSGSLLFISRSGLFSQRETRRQVLVAFTENSLHRVCAPDDVRVNVFILQHTFSDANFVTMCDHLKPNKINIQAIMNYSFYLRTTRKSVFNNERTLVVVHCKNIANNANIMNINCCGKTRHSFKIPTFQQEPCFGRPASSWYPSWCPQCSYPFGNLQNNYTLFCAWTLHTHCCLSLRRPRGPSLPGSLVAGPIWQLSCKMSILE